jgi:hypothetical protein
VRSLQLLISSTSEIAYLLFHCLNKLFYSSFLLFPFFPSNPRLHYLLVDHFKMTVFGGHLLLNPCLDVAPPPIMELKRSELLAHCSEIEMLAILLL